MILFDENESDSDLDVKVNKDYASRYNSWRQKEELNKLKTKYGDRENSSESNDTSSSSEDDDVETEISDQLEKDFFKTLSYLKKKDPKIYDDKTVFFKDEPNTNKKSEKKEKPLYLKDYERKVILEKGGKFEEDSDEETEKRSDSPTYVEEQKRIQDSLKEALKETEEDNDENENWGEMFKKREKTKQETEQEENDYKQWLKGQRKELENKEDESELKPLKDYWHDPNLNEGETFLRDYLLNKKYLGNEDANYVPTYEQIVHDSDENLSEDEKALETQAEFEHKYNFRFEEPGGETVTRYPRVVVNSVRKTDDHRKLKRQELKERKEKEKIEKRSELKQLKLLKMQEVKEKIQKLKEITGNDQMAFQEADLNDDFDPEEHDKRMRELFNNDYYDENNDDQKPEFEDLDEELGPWKDSNEPHCEDDDFNMDCDYDPVAAKQQKEKKNRRKQKKLRKNQKDDDPELPINEEEKDDEKYKEYMDEIDKLDYEDMIGDLPCRFKYREVVPNDFGLSIEEILLAKDKELNRWCSLKKVAQYRPDRVEKYDVLAYQAKAINIRHKQKILPSIFVENLEELQTDNIDTNLQKEISDVQEEINESEDQSKEVKEHLEELQTDNTDTNLQKNVQEEINESEDQSKETISKKKKKKKLLESKNKCEDLNEKCGKKTKSSVKQKIESKEDKSKEITENNDKNNFEIKEFPIPNEVNNPNTQQSKNTFSRRQKRNQKHKHTNTEKSETKKRKLSETELNDIPQKKQKLNKAMKSKSNNKFQNNTNLKISDSRLEAYGINPKKYKNKLKYKNLKKDSKNKDE